MMLGDFVDVLNFKITTLVLIGSAALIGLRHSIGPQVQCFAPAIFTQTMVQYAHSACWSNPSYYEPMGNMLWEKDSRKLSLNKWMPLIFIFHAIIISVPLLMWRIMLAMQKGLDVRGIVSRAREAGGASRPQAEADAALRRFADDFHTRLLANDLPSGATTCYVVVKCLSLVGSIVLLVLLNRLSGHVLFGLQVAAAAAYQAEAPEVDKLPRVFLCDFEVRMLGNVHRHTVQCIFLTNQLIIMLIVFIWFWYLFVILANIFALIYWFYVSLFSSSRVAFISRSNISNFGPNFVQRFTVHFLGVDGAFCLRLIERSLGPLISDRIINYLLINHAHHHGQNHLPTQNPTRNFQDPQRILINEESGKTRTMGPFLGHERYPSVDGNNHMAEAVAKQNSLYPGAPVEAAVKPKSIYPSAPVENDLEMDD